MAELRDPRPTTATISTLWLDIDRLGLTEKKPYTPTNSTGPTSPPSDVGGASGCRCATCGNTPPPYRPDFNPIEQAFAKLKAFLRAARQRSFAHVTTLLGVALSLFSPTECANNISNCGYGGATP